MSPQKGMHLYAGLAALLLAVLTYFYGLDGLHIPKNGDEYPYMHITRLTAQSDALLPLQSQLEGMRNTKPPLIFWQGIASTDWGQDWEHWRMRWPSVIYTLLTSLLIFLLSRKLAGLRAGLIAVLSFMAFMTTYRYGRPFLTDPPLVFWLFLPGFALLYWRPKAFDSRLVFPLLAGLALGIGFLYKSFMLLVPVGLTFAWWYWRERQYDIREFLLRDIWKLVLMALIGLGLFSLWFVFDPDPRAILQEFVFQENMGKVGQEHYLTKLLWGGSSIWSQAIGLVLNTGLLIVPATALIFQAFRNRKQLKGTERMLWIWVLVYFVIFSLPTQRSARYLLPVMPAIAILLALHWERIPRWAFRVSLFLSGLFILGIGYFALRLESFLGEASIYPVYLWFILAGALGLVLFAWLRKDWTRDLTPVASLLVFLCLAGFFFPFDHERGHYGSETITAMTGKDVWVPYNFRAKYERYGFLLPGATIHGYETQKNYTPEQLMRAHEYVVIRRAPDEQLDLASGCSVVDTRIDVRSRQNSREIREILFANRLDHLFVNEDLVHCPRQLP
jgi:4-amino-4-deoxy-L-arabinose transferase-like glycosyltransferase